MMENELMRVKNQWPEFISGYTEARGVDDGIMTDKDDGGEIKTKKQSSI